jgi:hypothetical protein
VTAPLLGPASAVWRWSPGGLRDARVRCLGCGGLVPPAAGAWRCWDGPLCLASVCASCAGGGGPAPVAGADNEREEPWTR